MQKERRLEIDTDTSKKGRSFLAIFHFQDKVFPQHFRSNLFGKLQLYIERYRWNKYEISYQVINESSRRVEISLPKINHGSRAWKRNFAA